MARYDKYDPKVGGFRAHLAADWTADDINTVWPVGLDVNGLVVKGGGQTGVLGVLVITRAMNAGEEPVDIMTAGEIVEYPTAAAPAAAGTVVYAATATPFDTGADADVPAGSTRIGHTVESKAGKGARLVVRVVPETTGGSAA